MLDQEVDERLLRRVSALGRFENCPVRATGSPLGALRALDLVRLLRERSAGGLRKMRDRSLALRGRRRLLDVPAGRRPLCRTRHVTPPTRYGADGGPLTRPFRFTVQANTPPTGLDWPAFARRLESIGYGGLVM